MQSSANLLHCFIRKTTVFTACHLEENTGKQNLYVLARSPDIQQLKMDSMPCLFILSGVFNTHTHILYVIHVSPTHPDTRIKQTMYTTTCSYNHTHCGMHVSMYTCIQVVSITHTAVQCGDVYMLCRSHVVAITYTSAFSIQYTICSLCADIYML